MNLSLGAQSVGHIVEAVFKNIFYQRFPQLETYGGCCKTLEISHKTHHPEDLS
jgi:hypothetical protein